MADQVGVYLHLWRQQAQAGAVGQVQRLFQADALIRGHLQAAKLAQALGLQAQDAFALGLDRGVEGQ